MDEFVIALRNEAARYGESVQESERVKRSLFVTFDPPLRTTVKIHSATLRRIIVNLQQKLGMKMLRTYHMETYSFKDVNVVVGHQDGKYRIGIHKQLDFHKTYE